MLIPEAAGLQAPSGAEKISVRVRSVTIDGAFEDMADTNKQFINAVAGRRLTIAQIYQAAQIFEAAYAQAGYVLVRVSIPPQELKDGGTLKLVVVDGFIERIDVTALPERIRPIVVARTNSLIGKRHIKLNEIERRLLIAGDTPGLRLRSTIARGKQEGGTLLILDGIYQMVTGSITADNRLPESLGTWSYTASLALNSALGFGEQIYGSLTAPRDLNWAFTDGARIRVVGGGMIIPIGADGWIINPEYTLSRTRAADVFSVVFGSVAWFERWAVRTSYPLIRSRSGVFVLQAAFEAITQYTELVDLPELNRDRYRVLRAGADWGFPLIWGANFSSTTLFSRGLGGRDQSDAAASGIFLTRQGAGPVFSKLGITARVLQPLPEAFQLALIGRGQTTFNNPVLRSEQFAIDAIDGVSSFPAGTFMADEGLSGRAELLRPFEWRIQDFATTLVPYLFGATGRGYLRMPAVGLGAEPSSFTASSIGGGVRTGLDQLTSLRGFSAAVEFGKQYTDFPGFSAGYRTTAILSLRF